MRAERGRDGARLLMLKIFELAGSKDYVTRAAPHVLRHEERCVGKIMTLPVLRERGSVPRPTWKVGLSHNLRQTSNTYRFCPPKEKRVEVVM